MVVKGKGKVKKKGKLSNTPCMRAQLSGNEGTAPRILNFGLKGDEWAGSCCDFFTPRDEPPVPTG